MAPSMPQYFGTTAEDFPSDFMDDFDGKIVGAQYEHGDYSPNLLIRIRPEDYEYEARGEEVPDDENLPFVRLGMGRKNYEFSDDGRRIIGGPLPSRGTGAAKWIIAYCGVTGDRFPLDLTALNETPQKSLHWKQKTETHNIRGETVESNKLHATGAGIGKAVYDPTSSGSSGAGATGGESTGGGRRRRRAAQEPAQEQEAAPADEQPAEEEAPKQPRRRRGRQAQQQEQQQEANEQGDGTETTTAESEGVIETPLTHLITLVTKHGSEGLPKADVLTAAIDSGLTKGIATEVAKRGNIGKALREGLVEEEDGVLYPIEG